MQSDFNNEKRESWDRITQHELSRGIYRIIIIVIGARLPRFD